MDCEAYRHPNPSLAIAKGTYGSFLTRLRDCRDDRRPSIVRAPRYPPSLLASSGPMLLRAHADHEIGRVWGRLQVSSAGAGLDVEGAPLPAPAGEPGPAGPRRGLEPVATVATDARVHAVGLDACLRDARAGG